jgi:hypothetical protein
MIVSDVGRTTSGSSSSPGSGMSTRAVRPAMRRWCVTTAHSFAKPSTCSASFSRKLFGMNNGKYAFLWPGVLEHPVEHALDVLPDRVAPRLDHHAA